MLLPAVQGRLSLTFFSSLVAATNGFLAPSVGPNGAQSKVVRYSRTGLQGY